MHTVTIGKNGAQIAAAGLGCMAMSGGYGRPDDTESIATIHAALDAGLTLIDTGDFYGMGHNEMLVGEALKGGRRARAFVSVKFGALRGPDGSWSGYDLRPAAVKNFLSYSLRRLKTDYIDLYQPARYDHMVPLEDTLGAIADLVQAGYVRNIGLSEVSAQTLARAAALQPVAALQIEYSLMSRGIEREILPAARALGLPVVVYGVLVARADQRRDARAGRGRRRDPRPHAALSGRELRAQPRPGRGACDNRQGARVKRRATGLRLGALARARHRAADRRAHARAACRRPGGIIADAERGRAGGDRAGSAEGCGRRRALRRGADGAP